MKKEKNLITRSLINKPTDKEKRVITKEEKIKELENTNQEKIMKTDPNTTKRKKTDEMILL
jgi:hypothetical protein